MEIILLALLAGKSVLPGIDRESLDLQARAEALQPRAAISRTHRPQVRRASVELDLSSITTICRAAGRQDDPGRFIGRMSSAYNLSSGDADSLRSSCGAYLAGRADARRAGSAD